MKAILLLITLGCSNSLLMSAAPRIGLLPPKYSQELDGIMRLGTKESLQIFLKKMVRKGIFLSNCTVDELGTTPLMLAARYAKEDLASTLLAKGAHINAQNSDGKTALMEAVINNNAEMVLYLLQFGAIKTDLRDKRKRTALHYAAAQDACPHMAVALMDAGASAGIKDDMQKTALDVARHFRHDELVSRITKTVYSSGPLILGDDPQKEKQFSGYST